MAAFLQRSWSDKLWPLKTLETIHAHHLVLSNLNFVTNNPMGWVTLSTNKLELRGPNKIISKSIAALLLPSSLTLNVLKTIDSTGDGKLDLISTGDDYKK